MAAFFDALYLIVLNQTVSRIADTHLDDIADTSRLLAF